MALLQSAGERDARFLARNSGLDCPRNRRVRLLLRLFVPSGKNATSTSDQEINDGMSMCDQSRVDYGCQIQQRRHMHERRIRHLAHALSAEAPPSFTLALLHAVIVTGWHEVYFTSLAASPSFQGSRSLFDVLRDNRSTTLDAFEPWFKLARAADLSSEHTHTGEDLTNESYMNNNFGSRNQQRTCHTWRWEYQRSRCRSTLCVSTHSLHS